MSALLFTLSNFFSLRKSVYAQLSHIEKRLYIISRVLLVFWFLALFPGRVGFDTALALEMMKKGVGTDWWTGFYWRILQILTFGGSQVFLFSLLSYTLFWWSAFRLIKALTSTSNLVIRIQVTLTAIPVLPTFAMTVQHDVLFCSGVFLLVASELELAKGKISANQFVKSFLFFVIPLTLTTKQGTILLVLLIIRIVLVVGLRRGLSVGLISMILFVFLPSRNLDSTWTRQATPIPLLMDIKCAVQHPQAKVDARTWIELRKLMPESRWLEPQSCKEIDNNDWTKDVDYARLSWKNLLKVYFTLLPDHAEIFLMAHIQRSSTVLPPPFFRGPDNQVNLDYSEPIGSGTNLALQSNPPLLHPSIDLKRVDIFIAPLQPLEYIAQVGIFFVNQGSRYWAWGGLWFWAIIFHYLLNVRWQVKLNFFGIYWYLLGLHLALFAIGISATGRHVMPTIAIGLISLTALVFEKLRDTSNLIDRKSSEEQ